MSFRSALLASAAILTAGSAFAADLPARVAAPAPYIAAPMFTWTGFYVGLNAGAGFNNKNTGYLSNGFGTTTVFTTTGGGFGNGNDAGFTGGVQAGYNMQFGSIVAGIEADINYLDRGNRNGGVVTGVFTPVGGGATTTTVYTFNRGSSNNWFGTARGRLGIAFDRFLPYITGGFAFGGKNGGMSGTYVATGGAPGTGILVGSNNGGSSTGWTLGGGVEYAFSNNMSFKAEYLHVSLGNKTNTLYTAAGAPTSFSFNDKNKFDVVRAGVNFRF
jgi:outer membrane immunogenic protein